MPKRTTQRRRIGDDEQRIDDLHERVNVLSPLALQVAVLAAGTDELRTAIEKGFATVNAKLGELTTAIGGTDERVDELERVNARREGAASERQLIYEEISKRSTLRIAAHGWIRPAFAGALIAGALAVLQHLL